MGSTFSWVVAMDGEGTAMMDDPDACEPGERWIVGGRVSLGFGGEDDEAVTVVVETDGLAGKDAYGSMYGALGLLDREDAESALVRP